MHRWFIIFCCCCWWCFWFEALWASELWTSGVIESRAKRTETDNSGIFGTLLQPIFGPKFEGDEAEADNFVQATLPLNQRFERILFVTPGIAKGNPEAVKMTFFGLYCNLLGILLGRREVQSFTERGSFFKFKSMPSGELLKACLNEIETIFGGIKLMAAMIDLGPYELSYALQQECANRGMSLYRHPLNMQNDEIYYLPPPYSNFDLFFDEYPWNRDEFVNNGRKPFRTHQKYPPVIPRTFQQPIITAKDPVPVGTEEIIEKLEKIYGPFDEVHLNSPKNTEKTAIDNEPKKSEISYEDYEIVEYNCWE